jgi:hypothetical protein
MILHLVVQQPALRLLDGPNEVAERIEFPESNVHGQPPQPQRVVILVVMRGERPLPAELVYDALIRARCNAALPAGSIESAAHEHSRQ